MDGWVGGHDLGGDDDAKKRRDPSWKWSREVCLTDRGDSRCDEPEYGDGGSEKVPCSAHLPAHLRAGTLASLHSMGRHGGH